MDFDLDMLLQLLLGGGPMRGASDMPLTGDLASPYGADSDTAILQQRQSNELLSYLMSMMAGPAEPPSAREQMPVATEPDFGMMNKGRGGGRPTDNAPAWGMKGRGSRPTRNVPINPPLGSGPLSPPSWSLGITENYGDRWRVRSFPASGA